jgi:cytochrome c
MHRTKIAMRTVIATAGMLVLIVLSTAQAADPAAGQKIYSQQCALCHSTSAGRNLIGPSLDGVIGRKAGTVPGYSYSTANKNSGLTWDEATLDKYLVNPQKMIPGTKMTYAGLKNSAKRADLVAYLATLH